MNKWNSFRRSRSALILDVILLPVAIFVAIYRVGVSGMLEALKELPEHLRRNWEDRHWFWENPDIYE